MVSTPVDTPVTMPDEDPTVAMDGVLLVHTPPDIAFANVIDAATHTALGPVIAGSPDITVIILLDVSAPQLLVMMYKIVSGPAVTPVTTPPVDTVEFPVTLSHVPPVLSFVNVILEPTHTVDGPPIGTATGNGRTFTMILMESTEMPSFTCTMKESRPL